MAFLNAYVVAGLFGLFWNDLGEDRWNPTTIMTLFYYPVETLFIHTLIDMDVYSLFQNVQLMSIMESLVLEYKTRTGKEEDIQDVHLSLLRQIFSLSIHPFALGLDRENERRQPWKANSKGNLRTDQTAAHAPGSNDVLQS